MEVQNATATVAGFAVKAAGMALLASVVLMLSGCGKREVVLGSAANRLVQVEKLPEPALFAQDDLNSAFKLGSDDLISISVFGLREASVEKVRVDRSGRISVPLAGVVNAGGLTLEQLARELENRLRQAYVRDPKVAVALLEIESSRLTVDGQVLKPGLYPALPNMTLMQAVASAQGVTSDAQLTDVVIFRTIEGQRYAALFDLKAIRRGVYEDPKLFANDTIVVGDSAGRRLFRDLLQVIPLLTTPLIVALQN